MAMQVIHKQIITLKTNSVLDKQAFEVPIDAEMVDIQWDPRDPLGIAFWYKRNAVDTPDLLTGQSTKVWRFLLRVTDHEFPAKCSHLATLVRDGEAWHILDYDGHNIEWADL